MKRLSILALLAVSACTTPYGPTGFAGGYDQTQIEPDVFRVSYEGNGFTSAEVVQDMVLFRAAELTIRNKHSHFAILGSRSRTDVGWVSTPSSSRTSISGSTIGNTFYGTATTTRTPGTDIQVRKSTANITILTLPTKVEAPERIYDAAFICQSIGSKYKLTCNAAK